MKSKNNTLEPLLILKENDEFYTDLSYREIMNYAQRKGLKVKSEVVLVNEKCTTTPTVKRMQKVTIVKEASTQKV